MITQEELQRWDWQGRQKKADYSILCCPALWKIEKKRKHELEKIVDKRWRLVVCEHIKFKITVVCLSEDI